MNFLNPVVLFGLAAMVVPLLLHLFAKRRAHEVVFPSIRFLRLLQTDKIRLLKLKQLLILLLRTLILAFIVLGFARPAVRSAFRENARTSAVIIIDATASMTYTDNGEMLFNRARRIASDILGLMREGDRFAVIVSGASPVVIEPGMTDDARILADHLALNDPSLTGGNPSHAFAMAAEMLASSQTLNRELYYLTDRSMNALPDSMTLDPSIRLYVVILGPENRSGSVFDELRMTERMISPGHPLTFQAVGQVGHGAADAEVSFFVNGERKQQGMVVAQPGGRFSSEFTFTPESPGWYNVSAAVEEGYFDAGEIRRLAFLVPRPVHVLIVSSGVAEGFFLERILTPDPSDSTFIVDTIRPEQADQASLDQADVVILSGVTGLAEPVTQALISEVLSGGKGLVVIPPQNADTPLYRNGIFRDLFPLGKYVSVDLGERDGMHYLTMNQYDFSHPIMRGVSQGGQFTFPEITSFLAATPPSAARVFAKYNDGEMAAGEMSAGNGRIVLFTTDAGSLTGELAFSGVFIPILVRSVQYLSDTLPDIGQAETGIPQAFVVLPAGESVAQMALKRDDQPAQLISFERIGTRVSLSPLELEIPGFYSVTAGSRELLRLGVDIPLSETVFQRMGERIMAESLAGISWKSIGESDSVVEVVIRDRFGTELAGLFLGLALVLLVVEMVLARKA